MSIKVAVIGAGHLGRIHAKLLKQIDRVQVVAVADPSPGARNQIERELGLPTTDHWQHVLGQIDAAVIATPTIFHHEIAMELAGRGIHLLIEKPVTQTTAQARHLSRIAMSRDCRIQVGHVERFNPAFQAAPTAGTPRYIQSMRGSGYTFRSIDVGVVLDLMIHDIDLVCHLAQSEVSEVRAVGFSLFGKHEDVAQARLQFKNGLVANLTATRCHPQPTRRFEIFGTQGYVDIDMAKGKASKMAPPAWLRNREFDLDQVSDEQKDLIKDSLFGTVMPASELEFEPVNAILSEQQNWIDSIQDSNCQLEVPIQDGLLALEVASEIVKQIDSHAWTGSGNAVGPLCHPEMIVQPEFGIKRAA